MSFRRQRCRRQPPQQRTDVIGIATDQRARQGDHFPRSRRQPTHVGRNRRILTFGLMHFVHNVVVEVTFQPPVDILGDRPPIRMVRPLPQRLRGTPRWSRTSRFGFQFLGRNRHRPLGLALGLRDRFATLRTVRYSNRSLVERERRLPLGCHLGTALRHHEPFGGGGLIGSLTSVSRRDTS